jgi:hypothetical protein
VDAAPPGQLAGHLVGVGQRGDGLRRHERRRLDPAHAGGDEGLQHLQLGLEGDRRLELQAIPHADLADVHLRWQHQVELGHGALLGDRRCHWSAASSLSGLREPLGAPPAIMRHGTVPVHEVQ